MIRYDPAIIQKFAQKLYSRANSVILSYTLLGALIGLCGGGFFGVNVASNTRTIVWLVGAAAGGFIGFLIGSQRAFWLKLQAQIALCQMMIEINTRSAGHGPVPGSGFPVIVG